MVPIEGSHDRQLQKPFKVLKFKVLMSSLQTTMPWSWAACSGTVRRRAGRTRALPAGGRRRPATAAAPGPRGDPVACLRAALVGRRGGLLHPIRTPWPASPRRQGVREYSQYPVIWHPCALCSPSPAMHARGPPPRSIAWWMRSGMTAPSQYWRSPDLMSPPAC